MSKIGDRVSEIEHQQHSTSAAVTSQAALVAQAAPLTASHPTQAKITPHDWIELNRRLRKESNVIVFGIAESPSGDRNTRDDHDRRTILSLFKEISRPESDIVSHMRLYKRHETNSNSSQAQSAPTSNPKFPAPIILRLREPSLRNRILNAAKTLENSINFKKVSIRSDLT